MVNTVVLLPGWGFSAQAIQGLVDELKVVLPDFNVQLQPLPDMTGIETGTVIQQLDDELPKNSWLFGWSLGGMLATILAAQRQSACAGVISFASNACFVSSEKWPTAIAKSVFSEFYDTCQSDLSLGLKRFALLCSQGDEQPRQLSRELLKNALITETDSNLSSLDFLANLETSLAISRFSGPQLHLLAKRDALVPVETSIALQALNSNSVIEILGQSHASVLVQPQLFAKRIAAFILSNQHV